MVFLRDVFGRERLGKGAGGPAKDTPTEQVAKLYRQGLSKDQIIQGLQREGYTLDAINTALNMVDARESVQPFTVGQGGNMQDPFEFPEPHQMPTQMGAPSYPSADLAPAGSQEEKIQEIAEAIIEEKWGELVQSVSKVVEWKSSVEAKINKLDQQITDLKESFNHLNAGVLERLGGYDQNIKEVGTEIKALEKVFQKILPGFVDNVQELSRVAQTMRRIVPPQKK